MTFIPERAQWIKDHFTFVPQHTVSMIGSLAGRHILDVGCGDMMSDLGLLNIGARKITGIDVKPISIVTLERTAQVVSDAGYKLPDNFLEKIEPITYNGLDLPFADNTFDITFSWGVFEHVQNVPRVLSEMKRVLRPSGVCFIKVFPWFHCYHGSHLTDWVPEAFAHLTKSDDWLRQQLDIYLKKNPEQTGRVEHVWSEYKTLNKYSAERFYRDVQLANWKTHRWQLLSYPVDLTNAPKNLSLSELAICGLDCVLTK